jgi:hypothetical protein
MSEQATKQPISWGDFSVEMESGKSNWGVRRGNGGPYAIRDIRSKCDAELIARMLNTEVNKALTTANAKEARLREALETLMLIVGLTAFKYEGQRAALEDAMNHARAALAGEG